MKEEGIIEEVRTSKWASPIVTVEKEDGSIRMCGDFQSTVNPVCEDVSYPLPRTEEMLAQLAGRKRFTKIDLSQAYLQLPLSKQAREYTTINTHQGLFRFKRMPFGIKCATAIFQREIEAILKGVQHVVVRVDDILVTGEDDQSHLANVEEVLRRLYIAGLKAKMPKCRFFSA